MNTDVLAYPITDACRVIGCGRTTLYGYISAGKIEARSLGSRTVIPAESLHRFVASLPPAPIRVRPAADHGGEL